MNIVRKLKTSELPILTELFNYKDIDDKLWSKNNLAVVEFSQHRWLFFLSISKIDPQ